MPATETARRLRIFVQEVRNRLREANHPIRAWARYTGPVLTAIHQAARVRWARQILTGVGRTGKCPLHG